MVADNSSINFLFICSRSTAHRSTAVHFSINFGHSGCCFTLHSNWTPTFRYQHWPAELLKQLSNPNGSHLSLLLRLLRCFNSRCQIWRNQWQFVRSPGLGRGKGKWTKLGHVRANKENLMTGRKPCYGTLMNVFSLILKQCVLLIPCGLHGFS